MPFQAKIIACGTCTTAIATGTLVTRLIDCKPPLFIYFPTGLYHNTPDVSFPQSSQWFPFGCSLEDSECPNYCQLQKKKLQKKRKPKHLWDSGEGLKYISEWGVCRPCGGLSQWLMTNISNLIRPHRSWFNPNHNLSVHFKCTTGRVPHGSEYWSLAHLLWEHFLAQHHALCGTGNPEQIPFVYWQEYVSGLRLSK